MNKFNEVITNTSGDILPGHRVQVKDSGGAIVEIYADNGGTRFTDSSGNNVNYAVADTESGLAEFYWTAASGQTVEFQDANGNRVLAVADFANNFSTPETGENVDTVLGVDASDGNLGAFTGGTIPDDQAVKPALQALETAVETKITATTLAAAGGADLVGVSGGQTAQDTIDVTLGSRGSSNATTATSFADGTIVTLAGLQYEVDSTKTGTDSATNDLGVDGLVPNGQAEAGHFGITNSGDEATKIAAAVQWSIDNGKPVKFPKGTYRSDTRLTVDGPVWIEGEGEETVFDFSALTTQQTLFELTKTEANSTTVSTALPLGVGVNSFDLTDASAYSVGDMIMMRSTQKFSDADTSYKRGEIGIIESKSTNTITLTQGLRDTYSSGTITVTRVVPINRPIIKNIRIKGGGTSARQYGLRIDYAINPEVEGVSFEGVEDTGVSLSYCDGGHVHDCQGDDIAGITSGVGYAFAADLMTRDARFERLQSNGSSCLFSTGGLYPVWDNIVTECFGTNGASTRPVIQTHINGVRTIVDKNTITNSPIGIGMFGPYSKIKNNTVTDCTTAGLYYIDEGSVGLVQSGNTLRRNVTNVSIGANNGSRSGGGVVGPDFIYGSGTGGAGISCSADDMKIIVPHIELCSPGMLIQGDRATINLPHIYDTSNGAGNDYGIHTLGDDIRIIGGVIQEKNFTDLNYGILAQGNNLLVDGTDISGVIESRVVSATASTNTVVRNIKGNGNLQRWRVEISMGLAAGTNPGTVRTTVQSNYEIAGRSLTRGVVDNHWDLTGITTLASEYKKVVLCLSAGGAASIIEGEISSAQSTARLPRNIPWDVCPVGYVEVTQNYGGGALSVFGNFTGFIQV